MTGNQEPTQGPLTCFAFPMVSTPGAWGTAGGHQHTLTIPCGQEVAVSTESQHPHAHPRVRSVGGRLQGLQGNWHSGDLIWNIARERAELAWSRQQLRDAAREGRSHLKHSTEAQVLPPQDAAPLPARPCRGRVLARSRAAQPGCPLCPHTLAFVFPPHRVLVHCLPQAQLHGFYGFQMQKKLYKASGRRL